MNWLEGYSAEWTITKVDVNTWADKEIVSGVREVHIERDATDTAPLLETGTLLLDTETDFEEQWYRIWLTATQEVPKRVPIATLLFQQASAHYERDIRGTTVNGFSVLRPVADRKLPYGYYVPSGADGAKFVEKLLSETTPAPIVCEGSFALLDNVVFNVGASYLEAIWLVLNAGNWCMQIDGNGTIYIRPKPSIPSLDLDAAHAALLLPGIDDDTDLSDIPNRYFVVDGQDTAVATNENPQSIVSYPARGRWVDVVDMSPVRINGETLGVYAKRRLKEESTIVKKRVYRREYWEGVLPFSIVRGSLPSVGLDGDLRVLSQSLECGAGVSVAETVGQEVVL